MLQRFREYIEAQHLVGSNDRVLLAVSGGRDSVCMTHLFYRAHIPFAIAHCNFHLRPGDCDRDCLFVRQLAESLEVEFFSADFDTRDYAKQHHLGIEEAARRLRYDYLEELSFHNGFNVVATAHHKDDSIETFFLNLIRGTGIAGLHGIRPSSSRCIMELVRPMLCFTRSDIDDYVRRHHLPYVEDTTNSDYAIRRNRIRHQLMPLLREISPSIDRIMIDNMKRLSDVEDVYDTYVTSLSERLVHYGHSNFGFDYNYFNIEELLDIYPLKPTLYAMLSRYGFSAAVVGDIHRALSEAQTGTRFFSDSYIALIDRGRLILAEYPLLSKPQVEITTVFRDKLPYLGYGREESDIEYVDAALVHQPLTVRHWRSGDKFYPLGMTHSRLVSDLLKDCKLNAIEKYYVYVLVDADDRIVWVIGLRTDNRFRISAETQSALRLKLLPDSF